MNGEEKKLALDMWELWVANHDKNAEEHRNNIKDMGNKIDKLIVSMRCDEHHERMVWMQRWIALGFAYTSAIAIWFQWLINVLHGGKG